ncbi:chorismate mutase [Kroppenstedtia sanguinis]|uniref:chorismate mutase n=1 Tax=Kroppenstedtia sanguinis TaxID=1380684 RepID=A0ABW4CC92_9BACL
MSLRGIRGATTVSANESEAILNATRELLGEMTEKNGVRPADIASVFATMSPDLNATFPARGIRTIPEWKEVPLMCATEVDVPGALQKCIRLLILANSDEDASGIQHVYLREARQLRPDLVE